MKACKHCQGMFFPRNSMDKACSPDCAIALIGTDPKTVARAQKLVKKEEAERTKARKEKIKTRQQWLAEVQTVVNKYVRLRDKDLPCCSCERPSSWDGQWHASHFRSVGAASSVRFHLWNIHKGCSICNNHKSGNLEGYRPRLIEKIGADKVDWLMEQNELARYDIEYLKRLKAVITKKLKRLEARQ